MLFVIVRIIEIHIAKVVFVIAITNFIVDTFIVNLLTPMSSFSILLCIFYAQYSSHSYKIFRAIELVLKESR